MRVFNNMRLTFFAVLFALLLMLGNGVLAQQVQAPRYLPYKTVDARSLALARSTGAEVASLNINTLNPASITIINRAAASYNSFHSWENNFFTQEISFRTVSMNNHGFLVQLQYINSGLNALNYLGSAPLANPDLQNLQLSLAYSYAFSPVLSIGTVARAYTLWNELDATESLNADIGMIYAPTTYISYNLIFRGIGYGPQYEIIGNGDTILRNKNLRESLEYGATLYYPNQTEYRYFSLSAAAEALLGTGNVYFRGGIEVLPFPFISTRTGYYNGPNDQGFSFGLGLNFPFANINYSVLPDSRAIARGHQLELLIKF